MAESSLIVGSSDPQVSGRSLRKKSRAGEADAAPDAGRFALEPHVCRHCFGRLLSSQEGEARRYVCSNCGASAAGAGPDVLCACGLKLRNHGPGQALVPAGLRCQPNPAPRPDFPSLFVAAEPPP